MTDDDDDDYVRDFEEKMRDLLDELLSQVAAGEISAGDAQRVLDTSRAWNELTGIAAEMGAWSCPPEEKMRREEALIAKWPEACRRAGVGPMPMPDGITRTITAFRGRAS
jgi:hypothetical protein